MFATGATAIACANPSNDEAPTFARLLDRRILKAPLYHEPRWQPDKICGISNCAIQREYLRALFSERGAHLDNNLCNTLDCVVDFFRCVLPRDAESYGTSQAIADDAHSRQDVGWFQ